MKEYDESTASLQAKHVRKCALARPWTTFADAADGCTCPSGPAYYVVVRDGRSAAKTPVGRNRKNAERALRKIAVEVDDGVYQAQRNIAFAEWSRGWLESLETKATTVRSYESTVAYAVETFGRKPVRRLTPADISRFNGLLRERGIAPSTRAKHLRVLGACLQTALRHGYTSRNPVRDLSPGERPRAERAEAAYFENDELPPLFAELAGGLIKTLFLVALKTGMRQGEVVALTWGDVHLQDSVVRVARSYTDRTLHAPKNHERRDVDLTTEVVDLLGWWWGIAGQPTARDALVFPGADANGYISATTLLRGHLYPAMRRGGIDRIGPTGTARVFHSLRHTFAKRALESGAQLTWLSRHLGHSSVRVTTEVYGHWERAERRAQAARLVGAFGV